MSIPAHRERNESGSVMVATLLVALVLAALIATWSTRALAERKLNGVRSDSLEALYNAYGMLALAEAEVFRADYDPDTGQNLALQQALATESREIGGTGVTVEMLADARAGQFYYLTAENTVGQAKRRVRALIRGRQSFADYNYFVNSHPLGISGNPTPRGQIHTNRKLYLYFPDGAFVDPVSAVDGFEYVAGATEDNTTFSGPANPHADPIDDLINVDVAALAAQADHSVPDRGLDVKIRLNGQNAEITRFTRRGWHEYPAGSFQGVDPVYRTQTRTESVPVYEATTTTQTVQVPIYELQTEERIRNVPVYRTETQTVMQTQAVWVVDTGTSGGGGLDLGGTGQPGHWEYVQVPVQVQVQVVDHYVQETYTASFWVITGYRPEEQTITTWQIVRWETREITEEVFDHYSNTIVNVTGTGWTFVPGQMVDQEVVPADGVIYVEGDVLALEGTVQGRLTVASHGSVLLSGSLVYRDEEGRPAYLNGADPSAPYEANPDYRGTGTLGVIAEKDVLYTSELPDRFEVNASLLAKSGRVGISGIELDANGNATLSPAFNLNSTMPPPRNLTATSAQALNERLALGVNWLLSQGYTPEQASQYVSTTKEYFERQYGVALTMPAIAVTEPRFEPLSVLPEAKQQFVKESMRRLGGIISNQRPVSAFLGSNQQVHAGFLGGQSIFDTRLLRRPPVGFPDRPRPQQVSVITSEASQ